MSGGKSLSYRRIVCRSLFLTRDQTVKHFFYTILLVAALGTLGAVVRPDLVQQGAALIGLELPQNSAGTDKEFSSEDQLAQFLAQYPFAAGQHNTTVPTINVPTVIIPESIPPPIVPFPMPVAETPAPVYASSVQTAPVVSIQPVVPVQPDLVQLQIHWDNASWDSEAAVPIHHPPAPKQSVYIAEPIHEPFHHPHQDISAVFTAPPEVFSVVDHTVPPSSFAPTRYVPPQPQQPFQPPVAQPPPANTALQTPAVLFEEVPVHGTEMVARVGTQVILMGDILPKLRRTAIRFVAGNLGQMSEEDKAKVTRQEIEQVINDIAAKLYPEVLQEQILFALVYSDYLSQQSREQKTFFDERLGEEFDRKEVPEMMKEFNVENVAALRQYLEQQLGSSLEKERRQWIREQIVRQWISMSIGRAGAPTHAEMMEFYEKNVAMFTSTARARWQEMTVLFSRYNTEQETWSKMRWMGNQVASGTPFEEIARTKSDGFTASDGGVWDWTTKGSLRSAELEQAIFFQPVGQLSPAIIKSDRGLHVIRVLERQDEGVVPFVEAQVTIRERIQSQRAQQHQEEYLAELRRRFPAVVVRDRIDFDINNVRTASSVR